MFDSRKILAFGVILLISTLAVRAVDPGAVAAVKDLAVTTSGDSVEARISTTSPARVTYFELTKPRRLVVDFHDLENALSFKQKQVAAAGVERVRAERFQDKDRDATRIVFDLTDDAEYRVIDDKSQLVRVMFGHPSPAAPAVTAPAPVPSPVLAKPEPAAKAPAQVLLAEVSAPAETRTTPLAATITIPAALQVPPTVPTAQMATPAPRLACRL
jgi:hypothetical protein